MAPSIFRRDFPISRSRRRSRSAAQEAIADDINQYAITWGAKNLRDAIARQIRTYGRASRLIPRREITVCCGSTEAMMSTMMAIMQSRRRSCDLRAVL